MAQENNGESFQTETGTLKFGSGDLVIIKNEECWLVPALGIYDRFGAYLGETIEEAEKELEKREAANGQND